MHNILIEILRWTVFLISLLDCWKYKIISNKISRLKSSREHSRTFLNISIVYRILLLIYSFFILKDWVLIYSCLFALYTLAEAFYYVYYWYPYRMRGCKNFKRPSIWKYFWNSILPNHVRTRL